jgi:ribosomal protein L15
MPLVRRLPSAASAAPRAQPQIVNVSALPGSGRARVDAAALAPRAGARRDGPIKVLGEGARPGTWLAVSAVSASAREKIEAAGGRIEIVA